MKRRQFITILGTAVAWPLTARAQQPKLPTIGVLVVGAPDPEQFLRPFREGLQKAGYIDGQNIRLELSSAAGKTSLLPEAAGELVRLKVDAVVTWSRHRQLRQPSR